MKYLRTYENATQQATRLSPDQFKKYLDSCEHFNMSDRIIYRSIKLDFSYYYIDPWIPYNNFYEHDGKKYRKSAYLDEGENFYTLLMNHLPCWSKYPKRQVICSTERARAYGNPFRLIPLSDIKIGVVPSYDIQDDWDCKFYNKYNKSPMELTQFYSYRKINDENWESFKNSLKNYIKTDYYDKNSDLFDLNKLNEEFTPENLGFELINYKKFASGVELNHLSEFRAANEIWLDQPHLLMKL